MKKSYRLLITLLLVFAISISVIALSGCQNAANNENDNQQTSDENNQPESSDGSNSNLFTDTEYAYLVIATDPVEEYKIDLSGLSKNMNVLDLLSVAKDKYDIEYKDSDGFLYEVGALANDSQNGKYIFLYTSVERDFDVSIYMTTVEYKEQTLTSSGVGAKDMHIENGCIIYVGTIIY